MDIVDQLFAIEAIKQLKARYFRLMDTKDWDGLRHVFCDDAIFDARASLSIDGQAEEGPAAESNGWVYEGGDTIIDFIRGAIGINTTVHHGHCHEVSVESDTLASGVIAMEDQIWEPDGKTVLHGTGHYHETYQCVDGQWRIHRSRITRLSVRLGDA